MPNTNILGDPVVMSLLAGSYLRGATIDELVNDFGVSHVTILKHMRKNGFDRRHSSIGGYRSRNFKVSIAIYAFAHGVAVNRIASWLEISQPLVSYHLRSFREARRVEREVLLDMSTEQLEAWADAIDRMFLPYLEALEIGINAAPGASMPKRKKTEAFNPMNDPHLFQMMLGATRAGASILDVANDWGVGEGSLRMRMRAMGEPSRHGIKPRRFKLSIIFYAFAMGATNGEIARFLGVSRQFTHYHTSKKRKAEWFDGADVAILANLAETQLDVWAHAVDVEMLTPVEALKKALATPKGRRA